MIGPRGRREFPVRLALDRAAPIAVAVLAGGGVFAHELWQSAVLVGAALVSAVAASLARRRRPYLVVDDDGYAVESRGKERFRVAWGEVRSVQADRAEHALYVDTGEPQRNLLVPPQLGWGFRYVESEELYQLLVEKLADKVTWVERLDPHAARGK